MDNNRDYKSLIRSLVYLKVNHQEATTHLVTHLMQDLNDMSDKLAITEQELEIYRLQGAIKTAKRYLELIHSPQELLHRLDKR